MAQGPWVILSITSAIAHFLIYGDEVLRTCTGSHGSDDNDDIKNLEANGIISNATVQKKGLALSLRTEIGCLSKDEQIVEELRIACGIVLEDLLLRFESVGTREENPEQENGLRMTPPRLWEREDLEVLESRLSAFRSELEGQIIPWLKKTIDVMTLPESEEYGVFNTDLRNIIEILQDGHLGHPGKHKTRNYQIKEPVTMDPEGLLAELQLRGSSGDLIKDKLGSNPIECASPEKNKVLQDFILASLSFVSMRDREEDVAEAHKKTFEWIFDNENEQAVGSNFLQWLQDDNEGIYWINGKAGSGKSTLMRFIYDHKTTVERLGIWSGGRKLVLAGFFFWASGSVDQRSQVGLFRYLLFQLLDQHPSLMPIVFPEVWKRLSIAQIQDRQNLKIPWTMKLLTEGLRIFMEHVGSNVKICFFVDGLDELDGDHGFVIDLFASMVKSSHNGVKVCFSSRPWPIFEESFRSGPCLRLQDLTFKDMNRYVDDTFSNHPRVRRILRKEPENGRNLVKEAVKRADGVFLWITLVIRSLLEGLAPGDTVSDLQRRLYILPTDLDGLFYYNIFQTQPTEYVLQASRIFQLLHAREVVTDFTGDASASSLTLWELVLAEQSSQDLDIQSPVEWINHDVVATRCQETAKRMLSRCAGLIEIHQHQARKAGRVRFIDEKSSENVQTLARSRVTYLHRTVRDFLISSGVWATILRQTSFELFDAHLSLLRSIILRLRLPLEEPSHHGRFDEWWPDIVLALTHARHVSPGAFSTQSLALISCLDETLTQYWSPRASGSDDHWALSAFGSYEIRNKYIHLSPIYNPFLALAIKFGLVEYVESCLASGRYPYKGGPTPLSYAVEFLIDRRSTVFPLSSLDMVRTILRHGDSPNQGYMASYPLRETSSWIEVLEFLREGCRRGWITYYDVQPDGIRRWVEIMKLLIEYGAHPYATISQEGSSPAFSILDAVDLVLDKYKSAEVKGLRDLLIQKRAAVETHKSEGKIK